MAWSWDDLRHFLAVQRGGSLAGAARVLRVDPTTVGRRIDALEAALGVALFLRRRDRWVLTPSGERLLPVAERAESTALDAERAVAAGGEEAAGRVRLTTLEEIAVRLVVPALPSLRERYPRIRVDLLCTAHRVDLARGAADLALRSGRPDEPDLVARRVATLTERPYIARSRLEALGQAASEVADLDGHDVVLLLTPERQTWTDGLGRVTAAIRATSPAATYAAIVAGAGVGLIPDLLAAEDPRLVPLPRLSVVQEHALWLVALPTALQVPRIRAVADHLGEVLAQLG